MKPLICFFQDNKYIYAVKYSLEACSEEQSVNEFLNSIENKFADKMKVVQINFEYENQKWFMHQKSLYTCAKASVFILDQYETLNEHDLLNRLSEKQFSADFASLESQATFIEKVNLIKKEIAAGRIYQVNLTAPLKSNCSASSEEIFKHYSAKFNGRYKALLPLEHCEAISLSPELFLQKTGTTLKTQPIKGSLAQNEELEKHLLLNKKEEAELSMIVDLLRNDLNRIESDSKASAKVTKHRQVMQLGYIQHTYSEIQIETNKNLPEILRSTLPGGSISGCPKIESLKLISELEMFKRQIYTGTIGWWKKNEFSLNLSIRTFVKSNDELYYHSGCGIVYDSIAEREWNEFILKTGSLVLQ